MDETEWPVLPPELEQSIFEMASSLVDEVTPDMVPELVNLMLVAKRTYLWVRPSLFRVLKVYKVFEDGLYFRPRLAKLDDVGKFVWHLFIHLDNRRHTEDILSACTNAFNVAIWYDGVMENLHPAPTHLEHLQTIPTLISLSIEATYLGLESLLPNAYSRLTYLDILDAEERTWSYWKPLTKLESLTHLALTSPVRANDVNRLLECCTKLEILIVLNAQEVENERQLLAIEDLRLVSIDDYHYTEGIRDFNAIINREPGLWEFARRIMYARQHGFFHLAENGTYDRGLSWSLVLTDEGRKWHAQLDKEV